MRKFLFAIVICFWNWLRVSFRKAKDFNKITDDLKKTIADATKKLRPKKKPRGKLIWDSRLGTFKRSTPKLGRNANCPCGRMRIAPRDVTKHNKVKWCTCGDKK